MMLLHGVVQHIILDLKLDKESIGITMALFPLLKSCLLFFGLLLFFFFFDTDTLPNNTIFPLRKLSDT